MVRTFKKGFTLIELLIVVTIGLLLTLFMTLPFRSFQDNQVLENAEDAMTAFIIQARTQTLSSYNDSSYGIHFSSSPTAQSSQIVMFKGTTYSPTDPNNTTLNLSTNATIVSVSLQGGGVDTIFNRLTGGTDEYGTITLQVIPGATTYTKVITINKAGAVGIN